MNFSTSLQPVLRLAKNYCCPTNSLKRQIEANISKHKNVYISTLQLCLQLLQQVLIKFLVQLKLFRVKCQFG